MLKKILLFSLFSFIISSVLVESMSITSLITEYDALDSIAIFDIGRPSLNRDSEWLSFEKNFNYKAEAE